MTSLAPSWQCEPMACGVSLKGSSNSNPVCQSHTGLHDRPIENSTHELAKLSSLFSAFRKCLKLQNWYHIILFCGLLWNVYIFSNMASENACALQSQEKYYFSKQNITSIQILTAHEGDG